MTQIAPTLGHVVAHIDDPGATVGHCSVNPRRTRLQVSNLRRETSRPFAPRTNRESASHHPNASRWYFASSPLDRASRAQHAAAARCRLDSSRFRLDSSWRFVQSSRHELGTSASSLGSALEPFTPADREHRAAVCDSTRVRRKRDAASAGPLPRFDASFSKRTGLRARRGDLVPSPAWFGPGAGHLWPAKRELAAPARHFDRPARCSGTGRVRFRNTVSRRPLLVMPPRQAK
jgi:hypothetical protein